MKTSSNFSNLPNHSPDAGKFDLTVLVSTIGFRLTAYIGGASSTKSVVDWLRNGLLPDIVPRMRAALDVVEPIATVESELIAQGFLIEQREETGTYQTPARMLRSADVESARSILMRVVAAEFLSNEVSNLDEIAVPLQNWIKHADLPKHVGYSCQVWIGRLYLTLVHNCFPENVQRNWDKGIDWPCWRQIIAAAPEMARARSEIDIETGSPFRYLRSRSLTPTDEEGANKRAR